MQKKTPTQTPNPLQLKKQLQLKQKLIKPQLQLQIHSKSKQTLNILYNSNLQKKLMQKLMPVPILRLIHPLAPRFLASDAKYYILKTKQQI